MRLRGAVALATLLLVLAPAGAATAKSSLEQPPKMCGVYARYACGSSAAKAKVKAKKRHAKTCGVYVKYSC
jgi:hypothetical protein